MNSQGVVQCMAIISGAYPNFTATDEMVLLWADGFSDTDTHTVQSALREWCQTEQWPPTIAGIRSKMAEAARAQARALAWTSRPEPNVHYLSFTEGRAVAAAAWAADCEARGVEVNWAWFDKSIGGGIGPVKPRRERASTTTHPTG